MFRLKRLSDNPVLLPIKEHEWEREAVFNAAVIYENNKFHLFYRASNNKFILNTEKPEENYKFVSSIGYAVSEDGINFKRFDQPVLKGETPQEAWGVEDPRITRIDNKYYILYTGFGGRSWLDFRICMAWSDDLKNWEGHRVVLDESNKDAALLPEKINGRYVLFHRRMPDIWVAYSDDLTVWYDHRIIMSPIPGTWESKKIGIAGPPVKMEDGWLLIYHGVDENNVYRLGAALLDLNDPSRVIARQREAILEPELDWEINGLVPNVVFSCGTVEVNGVYYVYYGAADTVIGVAVIEKEKVKF
jgi:Domain of unknown function (DUF377).